MYPPLYSLDIHEVRHFACLFHIKRLHYEYIDYHDNVEGLTTCFNFQMIPLTLSTKLLFFNTRKNVPSLSLTS